MGRNEAFEEEAGGAFELVRPIGRVPRLIRWFMVHNYLSFTPGNSKVRRGESEQGTDATTFPPPTPKVENKFSDWKCDFSLALYFANIPIHTNFFNSQAW